MVIALALLMIFLAWPGTQMQAQAQALNPAQVQATVVAEIIGEYPYVYAQPDFDAPVVANLKPGRFYRVSKQQYDLGFHRIWYAKDKVGFISSSEMRLATSSSSPNAKKKGSSSGNEGQKEQKKKPTKPIFMSRYQGVIFEQQNYVEDTMSSTRSDNILFFGYRLVGNNTLFSGEMPTDLAIIYHSGAPAYYEKITGQAASGQILNLQFTFDTVIPLSHNFMASYGFGPMLKYSHFQVSLPNPAGVGNDSYVLDDMNFGVLFRLGAATRLGIFGLRADVKYYIESKHYVGVNLSTLYEF